MSGYPNKPYDYGYGAPPSGQPYGTAAPYSSNPYGAAPPPHGQGSAYAPAAAPYAAPYGPSPGQKPPKDHSQPYGSGGGGYPPSQAPPYSSPFASLVPSAFPPGTDPNVIACFQMADQDGSGLIDDKELQMALSSYSQSFSLRTVHLLMYHFTNTNTRKIGTLYITFLSAFLFNWLFWNEIRMGKINISSELSRKISISGAWCWITRPRRHRESSQEATSGGCRRVSFRIRGDFVGFLLGSAYSWIWMTIMPLFHASSHICLLTLLHKLWSFTRHLLVNLLTLV